MAAQVGVGTSRAWLLILLGLSASPAHAQWAPNGVPLTTASGGQGVPRIASDGAGGAIVVWRDERDRLARSSDIYAQRVTADGRVSPGWPPDGFPVCTDSAYQDEPTIIADGEGGSYIAWIDRREGMTTGIDHIYLQRVTSQGVIASGWAPNGVPVCPTPGGQNGPHVAPDGLGGVFVVWEDFRRGLPNEYNGQVDIYAQRMTPEGTLAAGWPIDGLPACTAPGPRFGPRALADGADGSFVEWADGRNMGSSGFDIYALRLTADGAIAPGWVVDGVPVCTAPNHQDLGTVVPDDQDGFIVAWEDVRTAPPGGAFEPHTDIYAQRVTGSGSIALGWPENGIPVCTAPDLQNQHQIVSDHLGGAIVVWSDYRNYNPSAADLYAQRILADGKTAPGWPEDGVALSRAPYWQVAPTVVADGSGGALVAYQTTNATDDLYAQHVTKSGALASGWDPNGVPLCVAPGVHQRPVAVSDGSMGMIVAWEDSRGATGYLIYAQHVVGDIPTPTLVSFVSSDAEPDRVVLKWFSAVELTSVRVYRRSEGSEWVTLGSPQPVGRDVLVCVDRSVIGGRYAYRLGYASDAGEVFTPEVWVSVPSGYVLALAGFYPNPVAGEPRIALSLVSSQPAILRVFDTSGRAVVTSELNSIGPGKHLLPVGSRLAPGIYWLRLSQGGRSLTAKGVVVR